MSMPTWDEITGKLLARLATQPEYTNQRMIGELADDFALSEELRKELLPSGKQTRFANRVGWAKTHLQKAGLVERTRKGWFQITPAGVEVLRDLPEKLDSAYLSRFGEDYVAFVTPSELKEASLQDVAQSTEGATPREAMSAIHGMLRDQLAQVLLDTITSCSPSFFERLVVEVMVALGYGGSFPDARQVLGGSGDGGVDGIIKEDRLGLDVIYLQAKRWESTVGRPAVQAFAGSLEGFRARKGILITTSSFSSEAREYVRNIEKKIILIDGQELARLMMDVGVGVTEEERWTLLKIDHDFFSEE
jgi:restriction system protein